MLKQYKALWIGLVVGAVLMASAYAENPEPTPDLVFLCIGQSNMAGRAPMLEGDQEVIDGVLLLNADGKWEPARQPLNRYATDRKGIKQQRFGPAGPFAAAVRKAMPDKTIGLIVNARGGTKIELWEKGAPLYDNSLQRVAGLGDIRIAGVVWIQGFSNAGDGAYLAKLARLVDTLRADLKDPELPVVVAQVPVYEAKYPINDQIAKAPGSIKHLAVATNEDTGKCDDFHYDRESYIKIGERLAAAYLGLKEGGE